MWNGRHYQQQQKTQLSTAIGRIGIIHVLGTSSFGLFECDDNRHQMENCKRNEMKTKRNKQNEVICLKAIAAPAATWQSVQRQYLSHL